MKVHIILLLAVLALPVSAQSLLEGQWEMLASPFEGGEVRVPFTATLSADGTSLACHSEKFITNGTQTYPIDWTILVEQQDQQVRLGWVLDADTPASSVEYQESASHYALFGNDADGTPRYIYLLSENIDTQQLEGMTLWSDWQAAEGTFTLPKVQQIYATVSTQQPYNGSVGYIDIWASIKLQHQATASIRSLLSEASQQSTVIHNLQGQRISSLSSLRGLFIVNGRKVVMK